MRAVNYKRVRVRNVNAGLDYRGAYEHIYLPRRHVRPYLLKAFLIHLTVRRDDGSVRHLARYLRRDTVYRLNGIVQVKDLSAAPQLALYSVCYDYIVMLEHVCLDRQTVARSLVQHRNIAYARHCHIERARDGRCTE